MAKKLSMETLKERRERIEDRVMRLRTTLESHGIERAKIYSAENKRRLTAQALAEDEQKLRAKTHASLTKWRSEIVDGIGDSFNHREQFSRDTLLRNARFFPAYSGTPGTVEAKIHSLLHELLEDTRRSNAERRAARYSAQDLALECGLAAERGDVATVSVLQQEARSRKLEGEEKLAVDLALRKLQLPETSEAEALYTDLEALTDETDALLSLWQNPTSESAKGRESLHRFNRRKRAEKVVADVEAEDARRKAEAEAKKREATIPMPPNDDFREPQQSSAA